MRHENPLDRNRALFDFVDRLGPDDFAAAVAHFRILGVTESRMGEYALLLSAWAKLDPLAALDFAKSNPDNKFVASTALATWAANDPDAAMPPPPKPGSNRIPYPSPYSTNSPTNWGNVECRGSLAMSYILEVWRRAEK
jgi:hypothetical protein